MKKRITIDFYCPMKDHPVTKEYLKQRNSKIDNMFSGLFDLIPEMKPKYVNDSEMSMGLVSLTLIVDYDKYTDPLEFVNSSINTTIEEFTKQFGKLDITFKITLLETVKPEDDEDEDTNNRLS